MKRHRSLMLKLLLWLRDRADGRKRFEPPECREYEPNIVTYHAELLLEEGLADGLVIELGDGSNKVRLRQVTSRGHDFIEANSE